MASRTQALDDLVTAACTGRGPSRVRQLRWVAGELALYAEGLPAKSRPRGRAGWFEPDFVAGYLAEADAGTLRRRGAAGRPSGEATKAVRRGCLRMLARQAGLPDPVPDQVPQPAPLSRVEPIPARLAIGHLANAAQRLRSASAVRAAAMAALTREAGLRTGEMAALRLADVDLTAGTVTYRPAPPRTGVTTEPRTVRLSRPTRRALAEWLEIRTTLVTMAPRSKALWVSLRGNHDGTGLRRPPGMPLRPNGIRRAHQRTVIQVNARLGDAPGYEPLPRVPGRLRPEAPEAKPEAKPGPARETREPG